MTSVVVALLFAACRPPLAAGVAPDVVPHVVRYAAPTYTEAGRRARIEGMVGIEVIVAADGTILEQEVAKDLPMGLAGACLRVLPSWRFNPSIVSRRRAKLEFVFQLAKPGQPPAGFRFEEPYRMIVWAEGPLLDNKRIAAAPEQTRSRPVGEPVLEPVSNARGDL